MRALVTSPLTPRRRQWLARRRRPVRWGNTRRLQPFSPRFGFDRGTPIDRYYMERFLAAESHAIRGVVGEIAEPQYAVSFGGPHVRAIEVIDLDPRNPRATVVADLADPDALPPDAFDCLIVTQTLQYLADPGAALRGLARALRPGATLLAALPALAPHDAREPSSQDFWRFWPAGVTDLLARALPTSAIRVVGYGNVLSATAFLHGISAQELSAAELDYVDERFPVVVCARAAVPIETAATPHSRRGGRRERS